MAPILILYGNPKTVSSKSTKEDKTARNVSKWSSMVCWCPLRFQLGSLHSEGTNNFWGMCKYFPQCTRTEKPWCTECSSCFLAGCWETTSFLTRKEEGVGGLLTQLAEIRAWPTFPIWIHSWHYLGFSLNLDWLEEAEVAADSQWNVFQGFVSLWKRRPTTWFHKFLTFSQMNSVYFQLNWVSMPLWSQLDWKKTQFNGENVKNLWNHVVGRCFHNETKPQETFHCVFFQMQKCHSEKRSLWNLNFAAS